MKLLRALSVLLPTAVLLPLIGCQDSPQSIVNQEASLAGGVSFQLDTAVLTAVKSTADSLRLELRKGTVLRTVTVKLDQTVRVTDLEPGEWTLDAALYNVAGILSWYAKGIVQVTPGGTAKAVLTLKPAKGSVDVIIRLDSSGLSRSDSLLRGEWFFETAYGKAIRVGAARPYIGLDVAGLSFYDGCNHSSGGSWSANGSSLSLKAGATTLMACLDSAGAWATDMNVNRAVGATAFWSIDSSKRLILRSADSVVIATLARTAQVGNGCIQYASDASACVTLPDPVWNSDSLLGNWYPHQLDSLPWYGKDLNLSIEMSGRIYGTIGCNRFGGTWWSSLDTLVLKPGAVTEMACLGDTGNPVHDRFAQSLTTVQGWRRTTKGMLEILGPGGQLIARFARYPNVQTTVDTVIWLPTDTVVTVPWIVTPVQPTEDPVLPACSTDSGLVVPAKDTAAMAGLGLDTALVKVISRCDSGIWLDVTLPDAGSTPVVFGYEDMTLGACGPACTAAFPVFVVRVRSLPSSQMSAQVLTRKRVFVPVANGSASIRFE